MGVTKQTLIPGNGQDYPARGSVVTIHYTGTLYDPSKTDDHCKGDQYVLHFPSSLASIEVKRIGNG